MSYEQPGDGLAYKLAIYSNALSLLSDGGITGYDHYTAIRVAHHVDVFGRWADYRAWLVTVSLSLQLSPNDERSLNRKRETCERGLRDAVQHINETLHNGERINIIKGITFDRLYPSLVMGNGRQSHAIGWYTDDLIDHVGAYEILTAGRNWGLATNSDERLLNAFGLVRGCQFLIYKLKSQVNISENAPIREAVDRLVTTLGRHYNAVSRLSLDITIDEDYNILADGDRVQQQNKKK